MQRVVQELNKLLINTKIIEIFTQEKDKLVIKLLTEDVKENYLIISVNPGLPYLLFRENYSRANKNVTNFFLDKLPFKFQSAEIAADDRIIRINTDKSKIYFAIRGKFTNVYFERKGLISMFKKVDIDGYEETFLQDVNGCKFIDRMSVPELPEDISGDALIDYVKARYPFISKDILLQAKIISDVNFRAKDIYQIIDKIINNNFLVNIYNDKIEIIPDQFITSQPLTSIRFDNIFNALSRFLSECYKLEETKSIKKNIEKHIERELERTTSTLNALNIRIQNGSRENEYRHIAGLILANIYNIKKGMKTVELLDYITEEMKQILLIEKYDPKSNADYYFDKAKSEKKAFEYSKKQFIEVNNKFEKYQNYRQQFNLLNSYDEYQKLAVELKIKKNAANIASTNITDKFRTFVIDDKYFVYVGKDNESNDLLTTRFAKPNDYWFHAKDTSGSHVILRVNGKTVEVPKQVLEEVASLAAYFSKSKSSNLVPVICTRKKYVVKRKGMDRGQVGVLREEQVLIVAPEIRNRNN